MSTYLTKTRALAAAVLLAIAVAFGLATAPQSQAYAEGGDSQLGAQGLKTQEDNALKLTSGVYDSDAFAFAWAGGTGKLGFNLEKIVINADGQVEGYFTTTSSALTHVYYGESTDKGDTDADYKENEKWIDKVSEISNKRFTIPVQLNSVVSFTCRTTAMDNPHWVKYSYFIGILKLPASTSMFAIDDSKTAKLAPEVVMKTSGTRTFPESINVSSVTLSIPMKSSSSHIKAYVGTIPKAKADPEHAISKENNVFSIPITSFADNTPAVVSFATDSSWMERKLTVACATAGLDIVSGETLAAGDDAYDALKAGFDRYQGVKDTLSYYTDDSKAAVETAIEKVPLNRKKDGLGTLYASEAASFLQIAQELKTALDNLEMKPADYSRIESAKKNVPANLDVYTSESAANLNNALGAVVEGKMIDEQATVDGWAQAIEDAIAALEYTPEGKAKVDLEAAKEAANVADAKAAAADEAAKAADDAMDKAAKSGTVEDAAAAVAAADKATKAAAEAATAAAAAKEAADVALKSADAIPDADAKAQAKQAAQAAVDTASSLVSKAETAKTTAAASAVKAAEAKKTAEEAAAAAAAAAKKAAEEEAAAKAPKDNTMQVSVKAKTLKAKKLKKKKQTVSAITVTDAKGAVTFSKVKVNKKKLAKKFTVNKKTGKITVKKGVKKGTYKVTVKVSAAGEGQFQPAEKNVVVTIKVK